jgi:ribosomal protein L29
MSMDESLLNAMKNKTLNDYDKELKSLKEENFNLRLRIYLIEEERQNESNAGAKKTISGEGVAKSSSSKQPGRSKSNSSIVSDDSTESSSNSMLNVGNREPVTSSSPTTTANNGRQRREKAASNAYLYDGYESGDQEIEIENLNKIVIYLSCSLLII